MARISAADDNGYAQCVTCGIKEHYKDMDGGHYINKGSSTYWALEPENIHPQCKGCNSFGMKFHNKESVYTLWMVDYYGRDFVDQMHANKKNIKKMYKTDYTDYLAETNKLIKWHKDRIGEP